jgi:hypothetical protein
VTDGRVDVVLEVEAFVLKAEAEARFDNADEIEALADALVGKERHLDAEVDDLLLDTKDFEVHGDLDKVIGVLLHELDLDLCRQVIKDVSGSNDKMYLERSENNFVSVPICNMEGYAAPVMVSEERFDLYSRVSVSFPSSCKTHKTDPYPE